MASAEVLIRGAPTPAKAKIRNPVWVVVFSVITLGIYAWFWWYFINREMRDLGQARGTDELGDNPTLSALAVSLGALIIVPPFVSFYGTGKRIQAAQRLTLGREEYSGWIALLLLVLWLAGITLLIPLTWGYMQSELNKVWRDPNVTDPLAPGLPHPGVRATGFGAPLPPTAQPAPGAEQPAPHPTAQQPASATDPAIQPTAQQPAPGAEHEPAGTAQPGGQQPGVEPEPAARTQPTAQQPAKPQEPGPADAAAQQQHAAQAPATAPADWYPDPTGQARLRYWDGQNWTQHTAQ